MCPTRPTRPALTDSSPHFSQEHQTVELLNRGLPAERAYRHAPTSATTFVPAQNG